MTRALLEQALDALQSCADNEENPMETREALSAIRAELARPAGEPVAFIDKHSHPWSSTLGTQQSLRWAADECTEATPLYLHPQHDEAEVQELLMWIGFYTDDDVAAIRRILKVSAP